MLCARRRREAAAAVRALGRQQARTHARTRTTHRPALHSPRWGRRRGSPRTPCARPRHRESRANRRAAPASRPGRNFRAPARADASPVSAAKRRSRQLGAWVRAWGVGERGKEAMRCVQSNHSRQARTRSRSLAAPPRLSSPMPGQASLALDHSHGLAVCFCWEQKRDGAPRRH